MSRRRSQLLPVLLIVSASVSAAVAVAWLVPSLTAASVNMLFRLRGALAPPGDIVIVAVDDASLQRLGNWPWRRSVMASVLDQITKARPRAVGLDVIYAETSDPAEDQKLAEAIRRDGRVVLPAQLTEVAPSSRSSSTWLMPLPELASAARGVGHAHADPDVDGVLRGVGLSKSDETGKRLWAFGLEALRVAEQIAPEEIEERRGSLRVGRHEIEVQDEAEPSTIPGVTVVRQNAMLVNYLGPARTFPYYSVADVLDGVVPADAFADKIVLVGAAAQTLGDTRITPFISYGGAGTEMPGVEVHANVIETVRRGAWLRTAPDWAAFAVALVVVLAAAAAVTLLDGWRATAALVALLALVVAGSLVAFDRYYFVPPVVPALTAFFCAVPLLLLQGSISASRDLDRKLEDLSRIQSEFVPRDEGALAPSRGRRAELPHNVAWKLRSVEEITARLVARMSFMSRVFTSMTEGLLVSDVSGRVVFANPASQKFWRDLAADDLAGSTLAELFARRGVINEERLRETMREVLAGGSVLIDVELPAREDRFHTIQFSAVVAGEGAANGAESQTRRAADGSPSDDGRADAGDAESARAEVIGVIVIITDVTKRRELERVRSETLQLVSHELRAPLTSLRGLSDLLLKYPVPEGESKEILGTIYSESVRMSELINRYLDLARIESGAQQLARRPFDANALVAECARSFSAQAAEKGIRVELSLAEPPPVLHGDEQLLAHAVGNLLSNAIKYSPADSTIRVACAGDGDGVSLRVSDEGDGIPPEARARVFEKFYRLERDANSAVVGTGLGLALVKEIVERHGGTVAVESAPGEGSAFTIRLPMGNDERETMK